MRKIILLLFALLFASCTDEEQARRVLENQGYTKIQITGYKHFSCGKDDSTSTGFNAMSPADKPVSGVVCCGLWLKNCTIRFE